MDALLTVRSKKIVDLEPVVESHVTRNPASRQKISISKDSLIEELRSQPDERTVVRILSSLAKADGGVSVHEPSPRLAGIVNVLVEKTVPDWWQQSSGSSPAEQGRVRDLLIQILRTVTGLSAVVNRIKSLVPSLKSKSKAKSNGEASSHISLLIGLLDVLLKDSGIARETHIQLVRSVQQEAKRVIAWREFVALIASGKVLSVVVEAEIVLKGANVTHAPSWLADGQSYTTWIGANIACMLQQGAKSADSGLIRAAVDILRKSLMSSHRDSLPNGLLFHERSHLSEAFSALRSSYPYLQTHEKRKLLISCVGILAKCNRIASTEVTPTIIGVCASFLHELIKDEDTMVACLKDLMLDVSSSALLGSTLLCRASVLGISGTEDVMENIFEQSLEKFGDQLYIKHAPMLEQETTAQLILLAAGSIHRSNPMALFTLARSSTHMQGISNRLNSPSKRAMWLGMVVSTSISNKIDKPDIRIKFDTDDMTTSEAKRYLGLIDVRDHFAPMVSLKDILFPQGKSPAQIGARVTTLGQSKPPVIKSIRPKTQVEPTQKSILQIIEVSDTSDDEDFAPYEKPDSDPEDEDEDPTLVNRDRPKAPAYIRDLITGLNEKENYDKHHIALSSATPLITRKANFGKEVTDNAEELANILMGLGDNFEMEGFEDLQQGALIATLLAAPSKVAPYIAQHFFNGDYSLQQRTVMLTTLGLGARRLAGFDQDEKNAPADAFSTKQLPPHLHKIYSQIQASPTKRIDDVSSKLERSVLQPMALDAADQLTGPNALKVRTFSSRMAVEKARKRPITNALAQSVAESFFYPLTGRWWSFIKGSSNGRSSIWTSTHLLPAFLRTLALIMHAAGPSTLALPQMTTEFWELLFSVRNTALAEKTLPVIESILFAFMMLLSVNEDKRRLAAEHANEVLETREWSRIVLENMGGSDAVNLSLSSRAAVKDDETERVRMLAAGVIMKCNEVVEKWQGLMLGHTIEL